MSGILRTGRGGFLDVSLLRVDEARLGKLKAGATLRRCVNRGSGGNLLVK
jgi:hypothetical protein